MMTLKQKVAFESIVGLVHRTAMRFAALPKEERAAALHVAHQSITAELGTTDPELIKICTQGIATVLRQIEGSGSPFGGHA